MSHRYHLVNGLKTFVPLIAPEVGKISLCYWLTRDQIRGKRDLKSIGRLIAELFLTL